MATDFRRARPHLCTVTRHAPRRDGHRAAAPAPSWVAQLRTNCAVLAAASPELITATTLIGRLDGRPDEAGRLRSTARRLAARHGLVAAVDVAEPLFTVRFGRRPDPEPPSDRGGASRGWLAAWLSRCGFGGT